MSCARRIVVVGDQRQLPPVAIDAAAGHTPPGPAFDCDRDLLASLSELYGADLPRTLLCEHYRCDPVIIGFCNKKFYEGALIPYTASGAAQPMVVVRTVEGNHMRQHRGGGRSNVTTLYRLQASKAADMLDQVQADTVHKFQGRQKRAVILTTAVNAMRCHLC